MEFNFTPIDEDLWGAQNFLKEGLADFKIKNVESATSSSGNPQMVLVMDLKQKDFVTERKDYIVLTDNCRWKLVALCKSIGKDALKEKVMVGKLDSADLIGAEGKCLLKKETYNGKERLKIKSYTSLSGNSNNVPEHVQTPDLEDDEVPF